MTSQYILYWYYIIHCFFCKLQNGIFISFCNNYFIPGWKKVKKGQGHFENIPQYTGNKLFWRKK